MALTFTPQNSALVLIDHQIGTMQLIKNLDLEHVKRATIALAKMVKIFSMPVVLTTSQEDRIQGPLIPELARILPEAYENRIIREGIVNAWTDPAFRQAIEATGKRNLIMAGVTTDVCLIFPSIDASEEGFSVHTVMDASGSPFEFSENFSQRRMAEAGVVLTAANTLISELAQNWATPEGQELVQMLFIDLLPPIIPATVGADRR